MPNKIKLENLVYRGFDPQTGEVSVQETIEFACSNCRHLVKATDLFCWQCGDKLEQSELVEHYYKGEKLTDKEFNKKVEALEAK